MTVTDQAAVETAATEEAPKVAKRKPKAPKPPVRLTFQTKELLAACEAALPFAGRHDFLQDRLRLVARNGTVTVSASDFESTITTRVKVAERKQAEAMVDAVAFTTVVKVAPASELTVEIGDDDVTVMAGSYVAQLRRSTDEFLEIAPLPESDLRATVAVAPLADAVRKAARAAATDDARPILTGVLFRGSTVVATDSFRLAVVDTSAELPDMLVPARETAAVFRVIAGDEDVAVHLDDRTVTFVAATATATLRLIEGDFPNYQGLIPEKTRSWFTLERRTLAEALKRVDQFTAETTRPVRLEVLVDGATLSVAGVTQDVGQASDSLPLVDSDDAAGAKMAFNPAFLAAGLAQFPDDDHITIDLEPGGSNGWALKPAVIHAGRPDQSLHLLMPVRVS